MIVSRPVRCTESMTEDCHSFVLVIDPRAMREAGHMFDPDRARLPGARSTAQTASLTTAMGLPADSDSASTSPQASRSHY